MIKGYWVLWVCCAWGRFGVQVFGVLAASGRKGHERIRLLMEPKIRLIEVLIPVSGSGFRVERLGFR